MYLVIIIATLSILAFAMALNSLRQRLDETEVEAIEDGVLLKIKVPKASEQGPLAAEMMFSALHGMLQEDGAQADILSFEVVSTVEGISFYAYVPQATRRFVESQIYAQYPTAEVFEVDDYTENIAKLQQNSTQSDAEKESEVETQVVGTELILENPYFYPSKTFPNFEVDPLSAITSAVENLQEDEQAWFQMVVKPLPEGWQEAGYEYLEVLRTGEEPEGRPIFVFLFDTLRASVGRFIKDILVGITLGPSTYMEREEGGGGGESYQMSPEQKEEEQAIQQKLALLGFETNVRVVGIGADEESAQRNVTSLVAAFKQFAHGSLKGFDRTEISKSPDGLVEE